jgi:hypothetical protein
MKHFKRNLGLLTFAAVTCIPAIAAPQEDEPEDIQAGFQASQKVTYTRFKLYPNNPKIEACIRDDSGNRPTATAFVVRGPLNDRLFLVGEHIKPGLQFDLFTVQKTSLLSNAQPDPNFDGKFGLAWYQSDLEANNKGRVYAQIETILLDQIFGFDANTGLPPTNTFHVGFWFNNPEDAKACGFDVTKPTPFNGEHKAGPLAMISVPNPKTGLGPLCTDPDRNHPGSCNP